MLNWIIDWSLRNRLLVFLLALGSIGLGIYSLTSLPIDAFPDTTPVQVQINTVAPALTPAEVERLITFPVEQAIISGMPRLDKLRSISKFGLSQVVVTFRDGTDIYFARQLIHERLSTVDLPPDIPDPEMGPVATGLGEVFHYKVISNQNDLIEARTLHDWVIKPKLRTVPGTAEINSWGGFKKQYQVRLDPDLLIKHDLSFDQVLHAIRNNNLNIGGGSINRAGEILLVHGVGRTTTVEQIDKIVVAAKDGIPIQIDDIGDVLISHELRHGAVTADGQGEVVLGLGFMLMGENSHTVTENLKKKLQEVKKSLPPEVSVQLLYDRTELVDHVIDTVRRNLFEGGLLVVTILFIFLGNLRAGLIVALAIPLSMLFAFCGMLRFGIAGSLLSLGALDFGLVVDSSVVMIENVMRHLSHTKDESKSLRNVVRDAAIEVRMPTLFGVLIIMIVYLPILTLEGVEGRMFRPMALTVIFALAGSLVLSLTLMPVLASLLLPRHIEEKDPLLVRAARSVYQPLLYTALRHRLLVVGVGLGLLIGAIIIARSLGSEFVPSLSEGAIVIGVKRPVGTALEESLRMNTQMEQSILARFPQEVEHVWCRTGRPEVATDPSGLEETDCFITLRPRDCWRRATNQDDLEDLIRKELQFLPGQTLQFTQPISQRVNEMLSGVRADVAVKIFGDDLEVLAGMAKKVRAVLKTVAGVQDLKIEQMFGQPVLGLHMDQDQLARYGVPASKVLDLIESVGGKTVGEVVEDQLRFPLAIRLPERLRDSPEAIGAMLLPAPSGQRIPLSHLAKIAVTEGPSTISREWGQRRITVQCNIRGRDMGSVVAEAQRKIDAEIDLPPGNYRIEWGGQFENLIRAQRRLLLIVPLALSLIFVLLYITFNNFIDVLRVFSGVPFACIGGIVALWLRDMPFSISAAVGFIALSGISVLNGMVLITFLRQLLERGISPLEAVPQAALARLRPVLMTALVASLGFIPMAVSTGMGSEVQRPLASVVIGGIISSTLLTLLLLPVLCLPIRSRSAKIPDIVT